VSISTKGDQSAHQLERALGFVRLGVVCGGLKNTTGLYSKLLKKRKVLVAGGGFEPPIPLGGIMRLNGQMFWDLVR
jgi:hypothetical protein